MAASLVDAMVQIVVGVVVALVVMAIQWRLAKNENQVRRSKK